MISWFTLAPLQLGLIELDVPTCLAVVGAVTAMGFVRWRAGRTGLSRKKAVDGVSLILVTAFIAGHVIDVLLYRRFELHSDWHRALFSGVNACSLGAGVGVVVATAIAFRAPRCAVDWRYVDEAALALLLGLAVLRVGCFLGHHHAGRLSACFLAVRYPGGARHDLGLYEAAFVLVIFAGVLAGAPRCRNGCPGVTTALALLAYGTCRFMLEFLRGDDIESIGRHSDSRYWGLTLVQYGAVLVTAYGGWHLRSVQRLRHDAPLRDSSHPGPV